jgi:hypothetical protein
MEGVARLKPGQQIITFFHEFMAAELEHKKGQPMAALLVWR